jgi:hypothetical protein
MGKWDACKKNMKKNKPEKWEEFKKQRRADKAKAYLIKIPVKPEQKAEVKKEQ